MGVTYCYVNHDKRQYFSCGLFACARFRSIGLGYGARAMAVLLSDRGTWRENRVSVMGDTTEAFADLQWNGVNIEVEVALMLIEVDGLEWIEAMLEENFDAFTFVCNIAFHLRDPSIMRLLDSKFGKGKWQRRYEKHTQGNTDLWAARIIKARDRALTLLI